MVKKEFTKVISQSGDDRLRLKIETEKGKVAERRRSEVRGQWSENETKICYEKIC